MSSGAESRLRVAVLGAAVCLAAAGCVDFNVQCTPNVQNPEGLAGYLGPTSNGQPVSLEKVAVRSGDHPIGQLLAESAFHGFDQLTPDPSKLPAFAVYNSGAIRTECRQSLSPGRVLRGWLKQIIPFDDILHSVPATFDEIHRIFEHSVGPFLKAPAAPLSNPPGLFLQVYGLVINVDCSQPAEVLDDAGNLVTPGKRVRTIQVMSRTNPGVVKCSLDFTGTGTTTCPGTELWVGTADYLYTGGDGYTAFSEISADATRDAEKLDFGITYFNATATYWSATYPSATSAFPGDPAQRYVFSNCVE